MRGYAALFVRITLDARSTSHLDASLLSVSGGDAIAA